MYQNPSSQHRQLLIAALPLAVIILFVLFSQLDTSRTMAQPEATQTSTEVPTITATPTAAIPTPDPQRQIDEYASIAHALQAQAIAQQNPFLAYSLAVESARIDNPPSESYASLLSMVYDTNALNTYDAGNNGMTALAFSDDGRKVAALTSAGQLIVFDAVTREILNTYRAPRGYVAGGDFTPDGSKLVLTLPDNQLLLIWDVETGRAQRVSVHDAFGLIEISPDGQTALVNSYFTGQLVMWDLNEQEALLTFASYVNSIMSMDISPDGNLALTGYYDGTLILWDLTTGNLLRTFEQRESSVRAIAFSPSGGGAVIAYDDGMLMGVGIASGQSFFHIPNAHNGAISDVEYTPNSFYVITGGVDGTVKIWDAEVMQVVQTLTAHHGSVNAIAVSDDSSMILSSTFDGEIISWIIGAREDSVGFYAHSGAVTSAAYSPDGRYAATGGNQNEILYWDTTTGQTRLTLIGHQGYVNSLAFAPDGRYLLSGSADGTAILWDISADEAVSTLEVGTVQVDDVAFSPDGLTAVVGTDASQVLLWDTDPDSETFGEVLHTFEDLSGFVFTVDYSPDGTMVAAGTSDGDVVVWDVESYDEIWRLSLERATSAVPSVALSMGNNLMRGNSQSTARVVFSLEFSPDSQQLAALLEGTEIVLYDAASGEQTLTISPDNFQFTTFTYNPVGHSLMTGDGGGFLRLWDTTTGQRIRSYQSSTYSINAVAFSPDGRHVVAGAGDFGARVWNVPTVPELVNTLLTQRYVPALTCAQRVTYRVEPRCDSDGDIPTQIATYPTLTATPRVRSVLPTFTPFPSTTPAPTPEDAGVAEVGTNRGEIEVGGGEVWTYSGSYGEVLNIYVNADEPANDTEDREGLFDTYLIVRAPSGNVLSVADDIDPGIITDSYISGLVLPTTGEYEIEVRSWNDESGGAYTLLIELTPYAPTPTFTPTPFMTATAQG